MKYKPGTILDDIHYDDPVTYVIITLEETWFPIEESKEYLVLLTFDTSLDEWNNWELVTLSERFLDTYTRVRHPA